MRIVAHRGVWESHEEQNSLAALVRANDLGFGIETDVWVLDGDLVISHDPPGTQLEHLRLGDLVGAIRKPAGPLCINVKSDGTAPLLKAYDTQLHAWEWYAFDMSMPETMRFQELSIPFLERVSEIESAHPAINSTGRWVDCFQGQITEKVGGELEETDLPMFVVSPELHGHAHARFWEHLSGIRTAPHATLAICTDFPVEARAFFAAVHS
jgi:hypothetical protein